MQDRPLRSEKEYSCSYSGISFLVLPYMPERQRGLSYVGFWCPPPPTPQYIAILITERGRAPLSFIGFWRPNAPPQTSQYLTILMTELGRHYPVRV